MREDLYLQKRWKRVQFLANEFWTRWRKEYLLSLQQRNKWNKSRRNAKINDIILLQDDSAPRNQWKLAKVVEVFPGTDGRVRRLKLLVSDATLDSKGARISKSVYLERPIHKTVLLHEADKRVTVRFNFRISEYKATEKGKSSLASVSWL